jgi:hypothetical protein
MKFWIVGKEQDKEFLKAIGLKLTNYSKHYGQWENVEISDDQLTALQKLWGTFYWGTDGESLLDAQAKRAGQAANAKS